MHFPFICYNTNMDRIKKLRHLWAMVLFVASLLLVAIGVSAPFADAMKETFWGALLYAHIRAPIVFNVGTGLFTGMVIWFFAVYLPERKKRKILRDSMRRCYKTFRHRVLMRLCQPLQDIAPALEELEDYKKFRAFFTQNRCEHWYFIVNYFGENQSYIHEILREMDIFCREAAHVRNNIDIQNPEVHKFLGGIVEVLFQYQNPYMDYSKDNIEPLMKCLFCILAQQSIAEGELDKDPIQTMFDEI